MQEETRKYIKLLALVSTMGISMVLAIVIAIVIGLLSGQVVSDQPVVLSYFYGLRDHCRV